MKRISIKDIANKAGVVPSTVSLVLNGKAREQRISDEVADRIRKIADETGYRPLQTAVSLRTGYSKTLGLIVEDISNVFFATLAKAIEEEAYASGYKIVYCSTENDNDKGRELIAMLTSQQVDGYLITPSPGMEAEIRKLKLTGKPVVLMDRYFPLLDVPSVLVDNFSGAMMGMEHLLKKGYRSIALVTVDLDQIQMKERERGYHIALQQWHLDLQESLVLNLPYQNSQEQIVEAIGLFFKEHPEVDAVFFATNYLGICGLEAVQYAKKKIPEDLAILCFDDHDLFRLYSPSITIIRQPIRDIAKSAIHLLMKQLDKNSPTIAENYLKQPEMVIRNST
ncbi:LacI family DNA-binding transcriptional regulator [Flavihumibacter sp. UBA7668]|uniref:LacI family DNA-binding transcriptional regulator n=1 Tax=Flavihumibacter sp. UBA7668 TaxID=1946542 RepID=UPI0025C43E82|nr:substrate-binding domain-containing protein [Flavihumibacter sp. UBA7668]